MYDGGGGGRDLTLERPDEEIVTKVQRPRSPRSAYPPATRLPGLQTALPPTITRLATSESETETLPMRP